MVGVGLVAAIGLTVHAAGAYATIDRIDQNAKINTANAILLFQDLATNGPRPPGSIDPNSRGEYTRALTQYVLDGTGVCIGLGVAFAGVMFRLNR